ncbi:RNA-binding S4 domain-containing protein [Longirhabdus pacifica]|uniref:RNA-binding S4 domain-containing protein n=1 Tax=Longirhabdus pacifica TaxID=2305227 RepID=UPI001008A3D7|nr:RNA-binding S4 domain-containing protein [Longirhabdus pacifica]
MRLDKFLKVSRLVKRRTVAKEFADAGRVLLNGVESKASSSVKVGDQLSIQYGQKTLIIEVNHLAESIHKAAAADMYSIIEEKAHTDHSLF